MIIDCIELNNFRSYDELYLEFDSDTNILYGDNAQGKTNILEAIYLCATSRSHRSNKDYELIKFDKDEAHIKLKVKKKDIDYRIDLHLKKNKSKGIAVNGIPIRKASELFGTVNVIFFSPENLSIIKNGPSERRKFIDMELCQLDKIYVYNLTNYSKVLEQRNKLLKDMAFRKDLEDTLDIWDMQLAEYGKNIIKKRRQFIENLNEIIKPIHESITEEKEDLKIIYNPNTDGDDFEEKLLKARQKDILLKTTSVGPHRDDLLFYNGDKDYKIYGSQGQKRTVALALKLAEIELVKRMAGDKPILLLDDVMSELDENRQNHLLNIIKDTQTIITCTGIDDFIEKRLNINKVYEVNDSKVSLKNNID